MKVWEVMLGMVMWGFGSIDDNGALVTAVLGNTYDLVESTSPPLMTTMPKLNAAYEGDPVAYASVESPNEVDVLGNVQVTVDWLLGPHWMRPWAALAFRTFPVSSSLTITQFRLL